MDKTTLERIIREKAEKRWEKLIDDLEQRIHEDLLLSQISIKTINHCGGIILSNIFNYQFKDESNLDFIKNQTISRFEKEEIDRLLNSIEKNNMLEKK